MKTRKYIDMNLKALSSTCFNISDALSDDDFDFAIENIGYAESQLNGLKQLIDQLKSKNRLVAA